MPEKITPSNQYMNMVKSSNPSLPGTVCEPRNPCPDTLTHRTGEFLHNQDLQTTADFCQFSQLVFCSRNQAYGNLDFQGESSTVSQIDVRASNSYVAFFGIGSQIWISDQGSRAKFVQRNKLAIICLFAKTNSVGTKKC